jgi:hypothetical protein
MLNAENATVPANVPFVKGKVIVRIRKFGVTALKTVTPFSYWFVCRTVGHLKVALLFPTSGFLGALAVRH